MKPLLINLSAVKHRPRLLSDSGPAYLSGKLREYLGDRKMAHTRGAPYHPQIQGKIERYHRTMKNVVKLQHYYFSWELEAALRDFVAYYNNERYHESLDNVTPADVYFGRQSEVLTKRAKIKRRTMPLVHRTGMSFQWPLPRCLPELRRLSPARGRRSSRARTAQRRHRARPRQPHRSVDPRLHSPRFPRWS